MFKRDKRAAALEKELRAVEKQEQKLQKAALKAKPAAWKTALESKVPEKVYQGLNSAFATGFSVVFRQGKSLIEKTYKKDEILADHSIRNYAVQVKGGRKEIKQMHKSAKQADFWNLTATTVEGIGLGALGIGMPDVVLFISTLLKGVYETALNYGFDYDSDAERMLILKMMAVPLSGEAWQERNREVDALLADLPEATAEMVEKQTKATASLFAVDMLLLKFIQGLPLVGIIGGAANPVYYSKIMHYVQLKYRKRYLWKLEREVMNHV